MQALSQKIKKRIWQKHHVWQEMRRLEEHFAEFPQLKEKNLDLYTLATTFTKAHREMISSLESLSSENESSVEKKLTEYLELADDTEQCYRNFQEQQKIENEKPGLFDQCDRIPGLEIFTEDDQENSKAQEFYNSYMAKRKKILFKIEYISSEKILIAVQHEVAKYIEEIKDLIEQFKAYKREQALLALKFALIEECEKLLGNQWYCSLSSCLLEQPVLTTSGVCFNRNNICTYIDKYHTHPKKINSPLSRKELISDDRLDLLVSVAKEDHLKISQMVANMTYEERFRVSKQVNYYAYRVNERSEQLFQLKIEMLEAYERNKLMEIQAVKDRLQIDLTNEEHLKFWNERTNRCFHGFGGVEITFGEHSYRVPKRIYTMMMAVSDPTLSKEELILKINELRTTSPSWSNPFSFFTRHEDTSRVYEANESDMETLDLRVPVANY